MDRGELKKLEKKRREARRLSRIEDRLEQLEKILAARDEQGQKSSI